MQRVPQETVGAAVHDPGPPVAAQASDAASMMPRGEQRLEHKASHRRDLAQLMTGRFDFFDFWMLERVLENCRAQ